MINKHNNFFRISLLILAIVLVGVIHLTAQEGGVNEIVTTIGRVFWLADDTLVNDAEASLIRMEHGVAMSFDAVGLTPGNVYTVWWIIFNYPENCSGGICGPDDAFLMGNDGRPVFDQNGQMQMNRINQESVGMSSMRATAGIVNEDGTAKFRAHLPIGDTSDFVAFGNGLVVDPMEAEIHFIIRTHGPVIPELLWEQLFSHDGGCIESEMRRLCRNVQYGIFLPAQ
jgi:hypothetical protein